MSNIVKIRGVDFDLESVPGDLRRAWYTAEGDAAQEAAGAAIIKFLTPALVLKSIQPGVLRANGMYPAAPRIAKVASATDLRK